MKINLEDVILNLDDEPIKDNGLALTTGRVAVQALASGHPQDGPQVKASKFELALKLHGQKSADLTVEEIKLMKDAVGTGFFTPVVYGRFCALVEQNDSVKKKGK